MSGLSNVCFLHWLTTSKGFFAFAVINFESPENALQSKHEWKGIFKVIFKCQCYLALGGHESRANLSQSSCKRHVLLVFRILAGFWGASRKKRYETSKQKSPETSLRIQSLVTVQLSQIFKKFLTTHSQDLSWPTSNTTKNCFSPPWTCRRCHANKGTHSTNNTLTTQRLPKGTWNDNSHTVTQNLMHILQQLCSF